MKRIFVVLIQLALILMSGCSEATKKFNPEVAPLKINPEHNGGNDMFPPKPIPDIRGDMQLQDAQPMLFYVLLDASSSIVGYAQGPHCKQQPPVHRDAIMQLLKLFQKIPKEKLTNLYIVIAKFGKPQNFSEKEFVADNVNQEAIDFLNGINNDDDDTDYANALRGAKERINEYQNYKNVSRSFLLMLTDGFRAKENMDGINVQLGQLEQEGVDFYVGLVCPDEGDTSFWEGHNVLKGPSEWMQVIFENIRDFLPSPSGWIQHEDRIILPNPKFSQKATVYFEQFGNTTDNVLNLVEGQDKLPVSTNAPRVFSIYPTQDCNFGEVVMQSTNTTRGFWWVNYNFLSKPKITLENPPLIENNETVMLTANLYFDHTPDYKMLQSLRLCDKELHIAIYDLSYNNWKFEGELNLEEVSCGNFDEAICFDVGNRRLYKSWMWHPNYDSPQKNIYLGSYFDWGEDRLKNYTYTKMVFKPQILGEPKMFFDGGGSAPQKVIIEFEAAYNVSQPYVLMFANKNENIDENSQKVESQYDGYICPSVDSVDNEQYYRITKMGPVTDKDLFDYLVMFEQIPVPNSYSYIYRLYAYKYVFDVCGFEGLYFKWNENDISSKSSWKCTVDVDSQNIKCLPYDE